MNNKMDIKLNFNENKVVVVCEIKLDKTLNSLDFVLNRNLTITSMSSNERNLEWKITKTYVPMFRVESHQVNISDSLGFNQLLIKYEGTINGWCNFIEENAKALSFYSVWYPQELPEEILDCKVTIENAKNYHVIKGDYDETTESWFYENKKYDPGNIIAFKKGHFHQVNCDELTIYYSNPDEEKAVKYIQHNYQEVMAYYKDHLFKSKGINKLDIVSLSLNEEGQGAYFREELIVFSNFLDSNSTEEELALYFGWLMAHELAHHWCEGADIDSWEDWLNETTAEWSAILYSLHAKNSKLFDYIITPKLDEYLELPEIKTQDETRPYGVHSKGTALFYFLYKKYGVETIEKLVTIFVNLENKSTS
ncbi:MAG: hypothetical protein ACRCST_09470, partial [Turicibacter sp.]